LAISPFASHGAEKDLSACPQRGRKRESSGYNGKSRAALSRRAGSDETVLESMARLSSAAINVKSLRCRIFAAASSIGREGLDTAGGRDHGFVMIVDGRNKLKD
jgi:hypothetical protein